MRAILSFAVAVFACTQILGQNVGIGTATPDARLTIIAPSTVSHLKVSTSPTGNGMALFIPAGTAPTLGFNIHANTGNYRMVGNGYGMIMQFNSTTGQLNLHHSTNTANADDVAVFTGASTIFRQNGDKQFNQYTGFNINPNPDSGRVAILHNSTISSPTLQLIEGSTTDYARIEFSNQANNRFWHIAGTQSNAGVADDRLNFYHPIVGDIISLRGDGRVGIGGFSSHATGYKLSVKGKIMCEELRVQLFSAWPDYVFSDNYKLRPIAQLEQFILQNRHLPGIPSAEKLEKDGVDVGDLQKRMMEKIEELTLYIIQQQKQIDDLKASIRH